MRLKVCELDYFRFFIHISSLEPISSTHCFLKQVNFTEFLFPATLLILLYYQQQGVITSMLQTRITNFL